jgi:hypothetical protein
MHLEVTPQPSDEERAAIEAALGEDAQEERPSAWADNLLPKPGDDPDPYPYP